MNRKTFLYKTRAGFAAWLTMPGVWAYDACQTDWQPFDFRPFRPGETAAPVMQVTPNDGYYVHTFYDVCPWSPSGRYLAVSRLPYQRQKPVWGDVAAVCIIDLERRAIRTVYETRAWSFQVGANVQWGYTNDRYL